MAENTKIEWATHTYNPWIGCTKVGPACDHCYAEDLMDVRYKRVNWGPGEARVRTSPQTRNAPFKWDREAAKSGKKATVFCLSLGDIWDNEVDPLWRREAFDVMRATPNLIYLLLSKRIGNAVRMAEEAGGLPPNTALGSTMINQPEWDRDAPKLIEAAEILCALFTFASIEPMLGPIDPTNHLPGIHIKVPQNKPIGAAPWAEDETVGDYVKRIGGTITPRKGIDWIICGGESGHHARPMHPQWVRDLRDACEEHGIPFFFKQWGEWRPILGPGLAGLHTKQVFTEGRVFEGNQIFDFECGQLTVRMGKHAAGRLLDGRDHNGFPKEIAG